MTSVRKSALDNKQSIYISPDQIQKINDNDEELRFQGAKSNVATATLIATVIKLAEQFYTRIYPDNALHHYAYSQNKEEIDRIGREGFDKTSIFNIINDNPEIQKLLNNAEVTGKYKRYLDAIDATVRSFYKDTETTDILAKLQADQNPDVAEFKHQVNINFKNDVKRIMQKEFLKTRPSFDDLAFFDVYFSGMKNDITFYRLYLKSMFGVGPNMKLIAEKVTAALNSQLSEVRNEMGSSLRLSLYYPELFALSAAYGFVLPLLMYKQPYGFGRTQLKKPMNITYQSFSEAKRYIDQQEKQLASNRKWSKFWDVAATAAFAYGFGNMVTSSATSLDPILIGSSTIYGAVSVGFYFLKNKKENERKARKNELSAVLAQLKESFDFTVNMEFLASCILSFKDENKLALFVSLLSHLKVSFTSIDNAITLTTDQDVIVKLKKLAQAGPFDKLFINDKKINKIFVRLNYYNYLLGVDVALQEDFQSQPLLSFTKFVQVSLVSGPYKSQLMARFKDVVETSDNKLTFKLGVNTANIDLDFLQNIIIDIGKTHSFNNSPVIKARKDKKEKAKESSTKVLVEAMSTTSGSSSVSSSSSSDNDLVITWEGIGTYRVGAKNNKIKPVENDEHGKFFVMANFNPEKLPDPIAGQKFFTQCQNPKFARAENQPGLKHLATGGYELKIPHSDLRMFAPARKDTTDQYHLFVYTEDSLARGLHRNTSQ